MRDREWCILHCSICFRSPVWFSRSQFLFLLGIKGPRHRAIMRRRLRELDCRLSRGRWHWWVIDPWDIGETPPQVCERCGATVGDWGDA